MAIVVGNTSRRFVILHHLTPPDSARPSHWDLMLEFGDSLRTWALPEEPTTNQTQTVDALSAHRLAYLDYAGPISGNRGHVTQWDRGTFDVIRESDSQLEVLLRGEQLSCRAVLSSLPERPEQWQLSLQAVSHG